MKILWLAPYPYIIEGKTIFKGQWITTLADELSKGNDVELSILTTSTKIKRHFEIVTSHNVKHLYLKVPSAKLDLITFYKLRINKIRDFLSDQNERYDVIHVHGTEHQFQSALTSLSPPVVTSMQGIMCVIRNYIKRNTKYGYKNYAQAIFSYLSWNLAAHYELSNIKGFNNFICRTQLDSNFIKKINPNAKIYNCWEMIRPKFFSFDYNSNANKILFMGGTHQLKGIKEFLQAFNIVRNKAKLKAIIIGYCESTIVRKILNDFKLSNIQLEDIEYRGSVNTDGIINAYTESFCLVHPSLIDNSPNAICEAQVAGLPVIATNVGGVNSLIIDGVSGLFCNNNPLDISEKILELYKNYKLCESLSYNSKSMARERHDPSKILINILEIYKSVLQS